MKTTIRQQEIKEKAVFVGEAQMENYLSREYTKNQIRDIYDGENSFWNFVNSFDSKDFGSVEMLNDYFTEEKYTGGEREYASQSIDHAMFDYYANLCVSIRDELLEK